MSDFLNKLQGAQVNTATTQVASEVQATSTDTAALQELTKDDTPVVQDRPDLAAAHEALNGLLGGINVGMDNSATAVPSPAYGFAQFGSTEDGMATPGYYSINKGRVLGEVAAQVGGRFYFSLDVRDELKEALEQLVQSGVYEKVDVAE